jgi:hypothetical protein
MELVPTLSDVGRHPEMAMAASKPEVVITHERNEISAKFQRIPTFSDIPDTMERVPTSTDVGRHPEMAMAASKPELVITHERNEIGEIPTASPTFSNMPDTMELVPTLFDVGRHPEMAMAASKPEVVITHERNEISAKFQQLHPHFRTCPTQWNWFQPCPMSADTRKWQWRRVNRK